jgi:hypothetical protein
MPMFLLLMPLWQLLRIPVFLAPVLPQPARRSSLYGGQQPLLMPFMLHLLAKGMVLLIWMRKQPLKHLQSLKLEDAVWLVRSSRSHIEIERVSCTFFSKKLPMETIHLECPKWNRYLPYVHPYACTLLVLVYYHTTCILPQLRTVVR